MAENDLWARAEAALRAEEDDYWLAVAQVGRWADGQVVALEGAVLRAVGVNGRWCVCVRGGAVRGSLSRERVAL